jgi:hypothetical protein
MKSLLPWCVVLLGGCYSYPNPNCPQPHWLDLSWSRETCPDPANDRLRVIIARTTYVDGATIELACQPDLQMIDVSRWFGDIDIAIQVVSGSGQILGTFKETVGLYPPEQTGDFQCPDPSISFGQFPDAGTNDGAADDGS